MFDAKSQGRRWQHVRRVTLVDHDGNPVKVFTGIVWHSTGIAVPAIRFGGTEGVLDVQRTSLLIADLRQVMWHMAMIEKGEHR